MIREALESDELSWKPIQLKRGQLLSRAGEIEQYFYIVVKGALRAYTIVEEKEFTVRFAYKDSIFTSLSSYFSGEPGEMYIEAIRNSEVLQCKRAEMEAFIQSNQERLIEYKSLLEQLVIGCIDREHDLMLADPRARLERVRQRSPQLFQEVPHKYIAAYLRMTPETLSRLMNP